MFEINQKTYGAKNERVVVVLGGWGTTQRQLWLLGQLLASYRFKAIIITWPRDIMTADVKLTHERFMKVRDDVLTLIKKLPKKQQKNISLFGMSQGTILSFMIANVYPHVEKMVINITGSDLAETVWSWDKTMPELKSEIVKNKVTLKKLKNAWSDLSPINNLDHLKAKAVLLYLAKHDELIPFQSQEELLHALQSTDICVEAIINERHSHFTSALLNLLRFPLYVNFLKK